MRKLKFRAWDRKHERMLYSTIPEEQGKREFYPFVFEIGFSHWSISDMEIMQFIGRCDQNGKEIYEGDILKHSRGCFEGNCLVGWIPQEARFGIVNPIDEKCCSHDKGFHTFEIIGNVYEDDRMVNP